MVISDWSSDVCSSDLGLSASARNRQHLITGQIGSLNRFRGLCECTVMTSIAAQFGEGDEHLARVSDDCAMRLDRHRFAGIQQVRKRTFPKRRNNRLAGSSGEFVKIHGHIISLEAATPRIVRSEEHTYELQYIRRISYDVFCLK